MSRKIVRLTLDNLEALPSPCRSCLFWELRPRPSQPGRGPRRREGRVGLPGPARVGLVRPGGPGRRRPVGYMLYAPEAFVPGAAGFPTAPVSPDAVLLTTAYVAPEWANGGLGRMLVQGMARDLIKRDIRAIEAFGNTRGKGTMSCVLPVEFLGSVGFKTQRAHTDHAADADGAAHRHHLADRGGGGAGAPGGCRAPGAEGHTRAEGHPLAAGGRTALSLRTSEDRQAMYSDSSLSRVALGRAPTMDFTTSPPW